jgi:hypothetical protein
VIEPRYGWAPPAARSLGQDCIDFWKAAGGRLFEWQEQVIRGMLGVDEEGQFVSVDDGVCVARQNGKGVILQAIEVFFAFELRYPLVMHTAHEFATSQEHQLRLEAMIQDAPHLHGQVASYWHANGKEAINLKNGCRISFKARTKGGGRGYSGDLLVWDEAMVLPDAVIAAQKPTTRASSSPFGRKTIYAGSAVDQDYHPYGLNFARLRERGIGRGERCSWHEWSVPYDDPELLTEDLLEDRSLWPLGNPSMEDGLISDETMADEVMGMPSRIVAVELMGAGDWPRTDGQDESVITRQAWDALETPGSQLQAPYFLAFDVSPERRTAIALAGHNQDGDWHTEIQEHKQGTSWVVEWIAKAVETGDVEAVVCDGPPSPASSLKVLLEEAGVKVETFNAGEHTQSCGRLVDMVEEGALRHLGSAELRDAVLGARKRDLVDAWAWSRKNSRVDISPLVAATLALGVAAGVGAGDLAIY